MTQYKTMDTKSLPLTVSVTMAAKVCGLSRSYMRALIAAGEIPAFRGDPDNTDSTWHINTVALLDWLSARWPERVAERGA